MVFDNPNNKYLKYTDILHCAFEYYRDRIRKEIKHERENNNNFVIVDFFDRLDKSLNKTKDYYIQQISKLMENSDPNSLPHIAVLRSVLFVYYKDLNRCRELLNNQFNLYPVGEGSVKEKSDLVKDLINRVSIKTRSETKVN